MRLDLSKIYKDYMDTVMRNKNGILEVVPAPTNFIIESGLYYEETYNENIEKTAGVFPEKNLIKVSDAITGDEKHIYKVKDSYVNTTMCNRFSHKELLNKLKINNIRNDFNSNDIKIISTSVINNVCSNNGINIKVTDRSTGDINKSENIMDALLSYLYSITHILLVKYLFSNTVQNKVVLKMYIDNINSFNSLFNNMINSNNENCRSILMVINKYINSFISSFLMPYVNQDIKYIGAVKIDPTEAIMDCLIEQLADNIKKIMGKDETKVITYSQFRDHIKYCIAHNSNFIKLISNFNDNKYSVEEKINILMSSNKDENIILGSILKDRYDYEKQREDNVIKFYKKENVLIYSMNIIKILNSLSDKYINVDGYYNKDEPIKLLNITTDKITRRLEIPSNSHLKDSEKFKELLLLIKEGISNFPELFNQYEEDNRVYISAEILSKLDIIISREKYVIVYDIPYNNISGREEISKIEDKLLWSNEI